MQSVLDTIKNEKLIQSGDIIGVAVSGGSDSMALLHYLISKKDELDIQVVAIHFDHAIREESEQDANFVASFARENGIRLVRTRENVPYYCENKGTSIELGARECRYKFFDSLIEKGIVDKIATAHHMSDQAETILMHIFRGSGLNGAMGMSYKRGNYIKPMLNTEKYEIMSYIRANFIEYVDDETNMISDYNRNFLRNDIMPKIKERYPNVERSICNFANVCKEDNNYIEKQIFTDGIFAEKNSVHIPLSYFNYEGSIVNRIIFKSLKMIGVNVDIERKHIDLIKELALYAENGSKIDLPNKLVAFKEYEYLTLISKHTVSKADKKTFKQGVFKFDNFGTITVKKSNSLDVAIATHLIDAKKLPKDAVWRARQEGDEFTKFNGGTKKLKSYMINEKIPQRIRDTIPVLASGNKVYVIAGIQISDDVKVDENTKCTYAITIDKK